MALKHFPSFSSIAMLFLLKTRISQWLIGLGWWFEFLGSPYERDCYFWVPQESQTTHLPLVDARVISPLQKKRGWNLVGL